MVGVLCCIVKAGLEPWCDCNNITQLPSPSLNIFSIYINMNFMLNVNIGKFVTQPEFGLFLHGVLSCGLFVHRNVIFIQWDSVTIPDYNDLIMNTNTYK